MATKKKTGAVVDQAAPVYSKEQLVCIGQFCQ